MKATHLSMFNFPQCQPDLSVHTLQSGNRFALSHRKCPNPPSITPNLFYQEILPYLQSQEGHMESISGPLGWEMHGLSLDSGPFF